MPDRLLLLDTDILSLSGRQHPPPGLRPWLLEVGIERLAIGFPVFTELMRGAYLLAGRNPERAAAIRVWIEGIMADEFTVPSMGPEVAEVYGHMTSVPCFRHMWTAGRSNKSNRLGHDLMIAALSIVHDAPIITANPRDYMRINDRFALPGVYQPIEGHWYVEPHLPMTLPAIRPADGNAPCNSTRTLMRESGQSIVSI